MGGFGQARTKGLAWGQRSSQGTGTLHEAGCSLVGSRNYQENLVKREFSEPHLFWFFPLLPS